MLKNIRDYFLMVSLLFAFNCMTKKQNIVLPEFELSYSDVIYKSDHPESPDHIFYIKSDHISTGCESSFSDKGYYSMEKRRKEIYKNILLTLEKLTRNHGLDLVGLESLNLGDSIFEGKSRYPSEIPKNKLDSILRGTNYLPCFMIKETFGDKIFTFGISDIILSKRNLKINEEISEIEREFYNKGMMVYGEEEYLIWNPDRERKSPDRDLCSLMARYEHQYAKRKKIMEEREESSIVSLLTQMEKRGKNLAAFVMGASHEENIKELLNKLGISFYVLEPKGYRDENLVSNKNKKTPQCRK